MFGLDFSFSVGVCGLRNEKMTGFCSDLSGSVSEVEIVYFCCVCLKLSKIKSCT